MATRAERVNARAIVNAQDLAEAEAARAARAEAARATAGEGDPPPGEEQLPPTEVDNRRNLGDAAARDLAMVLAFKRLGMRDEAANYMVNEQDINTVEKFAELDEDQIDQLCSACSKNAKNPPYNTAFNIGIICKTNFNRASFYCKYAKMTSRKIGHGDITVENANRIKDFKKEIEAKDKPEKEPTAPVQHKAFEFFENFREYLDDYIGNISGRPLTYVVRENTEVLDSDIDPAIGMPDTAYATYYREIEARAPIKSFINGRVVVDTQFSHDNVLVWKILYNLLKGTTYLTYIKEFTTKQDGREAFKALNSHLLGTQAINTYAARAENALHTLHLDGTRKSTNWNLDKYVQAHIEQHVILDKLTKYGHKGIGEAQKIHYFLQGITAPNLLTVKASLSVNPKATFTETSMAFKTYTTAEPENRRTTGKQVVIASTATSTGNRKNDKPYKGPTLKGDGYDPTKDYSQYKLPNRFYAKDEWAKLTKGQRNYLRQSRKITKNEHKESKRKIAELQATVESLKLASKGKKTTKTNTDDSSYQPSSEDESVPPRKKSKKTLQSKRR